MQDPSSARPLPSSAQELVTGGQHAFNPLSGSIISAPIVCRWYTKFHMETEQSVNTWFPRWCFYMFLPHTAQLLWPLWKFDGFLVGGSSIKMPFSGPWSVNEENPLFLDHVRGERMDFHSYVSLLEGIPLVHVQITSCLLYVPWYPHEIHYIPISILDKLLLFLMMYIILPMFRDIRTLLHLFLVDFTFHGQRQHFGRFPRPNFPPASGAATPCARRAEGSRNSKERLAPWVQKFQQFLEIREIRGDIFGHQMKIFVFSMWVKQKNTVNHPPGKPFL